MNLAQAMAQLPEPPKDSKPPLWDYWRHDLWARAQSEDAEQFMKWPSIYHTMLQNHIPRAIRHEESTLPGRLRADLEITSYKDLQNASSHLALIHQAYHLTQFEMMTGKRVADMHRIYEFGGGFGAMCLVARLMGFMGTYFIRDYPEFGLLQKYYLESHAIKQVDWVDEYASIEGLDLLIACYSLSETDYAERDQVLERNPAANYLLLYSNVFERFDNCQYFQERAPLKANYLTHQPISHLPPESWYTFGWSKPRVIKISQSL